MSEPGTLATTSNGQLLTDQDAWWGTEADEVEGYDLLKDAALFQLVGVPFRIFTLTYRAGLQQKGCEWRNDYVSAELRVAPQPIWMRDMTRIMTRRRSFKLDDSSPLAQPGEQLVVNDGSTGFYRQTVQYLEAKELIVVPDDLPAEGGKNECRYDLPASKWTIPDTVPGSLADVRFAPDGEQITVFHVALRCTRGLRFSEYSNEFTGDEDARTWYIA